MQGLRIYAIYSKHLINKILIWRLLLLEMTQKIQAFCIILCSLLQFQLYQWNIHYFLSFLGVTSAFNELKTCWHLLSRVKCQVYWWPQLWPAIEIIIVAMAVLAYDQEQRHPTEHTSQTGGTYQRTVNANSERDNSLFTLSFKYFKKLMTFARHMSSISLR